MKKFLSILLAVALLFSLSACENVDLPGIVGGVTPTTRKDYDTNDLENMIAYMETLCEEACENTEKATSELLGVIGDSYDTYKANKTKVTEYFQSMYSGAEELFALLQTCSVDYFKCVADNGLDDYDKWDDAMEDFYDAWDDAMDDYYDAWDEAYDDVYELCDELISDAYDTHSYKECSEAWSAMYKEGSDAWSAMYQTHSDAWSRTYSEYSACWGGFYRGNTDVDAILAEANKDATSNEGSNNQTTEATTGNSSEAAGIRTAFKEAMDAYEAFYDEYCDILQQYYKNPTDMTLLAKYGELMNRAVEMDQAFAKWENEDLNTEEMKYYLEVNNRVMQKMLDVMG